MGEAVIAVFKIILAVILSPVVYVCAVNFPEHLDNYPPSYSEFFIWGAAGFVLVFLFVHSFRPLYQFGQNVMTGIFKFLAPLDRAVGRVLPFYTALILIAFYVTDKFFDVTPYLHYFIFFAGFSLGMHILLLAQELQEEEASFIKPSYFCRMSLYFIFCLFVVVLLLDLSAWRLTFPEYFLKAFEDARDIYMLTVRRIL